MVTPTGRSDGKNSMMASSSTSVISPRSLHMAPSDEIRMDSSPSSYSASSSSSAAAAAAAAAAASPSSGRPAFRMNSDSSTTISSILPAPSGGGDEKVNHNNSANKRQTQQQHSMKMMNQHHHRSLSSPLSTKIKSATPKEEGEQEKLSNTRHQVFRADSINSVAPTDDDGSLLSSSDHDNCENDVKTLFHNAYEYLHPGKLFRQIVYIYAERKLLVFFFIHFVCTMAVWLHFALIKFQQQHNAVPEGAPFYWWKRIIPPLEFGSMHAILLQMALIPLTMARYSISMLSGTFIDSFLPLNRTLRYHIHLGFTMVAIVFLATVVFFAFFGLLCRRGEQAFCDKFTSEIMITGYVILGSMLLIALTSHFRHRIPYEVFYVLHHLVFAMYVLTIAHTLDIEQRKGRSDRSQTFKWFSATILYYVCDRVAMHLNHKYRTRLVSSSSVSGSSNGAKMLILNIRRPALFRFQPGQYAYLKINKLGIHWHPFSIASDPSSSLLQFYVEVFGETSWTGQLWKMLDEDSNDSKFTYRQVDVEIMGPIGTPLAKTEDFSHALAIGTGTGIVPILSLFKQQVHQLLRLEPEAHFQALDRHRTKVHDVELAEESRSGSFAQCIANAFRVRKKQYHQLTEPRGTLVKNSIRKSIARRDGTSLSRAERRATMAQMKTAAFVATQSIYGTVLLSLFPVIGMSLIVLMISWNTIQIELYGFMLFFLKCFTVAFQAAFGAVAFFIWDATEFLTYIDIVFCLIAPFADWFWLLECRQRETLSNGNLTLYCMLTGYMVIRLWSMAVIPRHRSWKTRVEDDGVRVMERFDIVWTTRSASLVSEILPDINEIWKSLVEAWGEKNASAVCRISVYVTEKNKRSRDLLKSELRDTLLYKCGAIHFGRPNFAELIQDHTIELISNRRHSHSLLACVGSTQLAREIHHCKISNDMVTAITGHKSNHQMEFVSESYGGVKRRNEKAKTDQLEDEDKISETQVPGGLAKHLADLDRLSVRLTRSYDDGCDASNRFSDTSSKV